jgi:hypothetical protein
VVLVGWKLPPIWWVKLNTDGARKMGEIGGCGGVIRGRDGERIDSFAKGVGSYSVYIWKSCRGFYEG